MNLKKLLWCVLIGCGLGKRPNGGGGPSNDLQLQMECYERQCVSWALDNGRNIRVRVERCDAAADDIFPRKMYVYPESVFEFFTNEMEFHTEYRDSNGTSRRLFFTIANSTLTLCHDSQQCIVCPCEPWEKERCSREPKPECTSVIYVS